MREYDFYLERLGLDIVDKAAEAIQLYFECSEFFEADFFDLLIHIANAIKKWTNFGYVGYKKEELEEEIFQEFWVSLKDFVVFCMRDDANELEKEFANTIAYTGNIYRLIGNSDCRKDKEFKLEYNDVYVSWDKIEFNSNVYECLYEPVFWIAAEIRWPEFGFDIKKFDRWYNEKVGENFQIAKDDEDEVVFPTKESCVLSVQKINSTDMFKREGEVR